MIIVLEFGKLEKENIRWPKFQVEQGLDDKNPMNWYFYNVPVHLFYNWLLKYEEVRKLFDFIGNPNYQFGQEELFIPLSNSFIDIIDGLPMHDKVTQEHKNLALWLKAWTIITIDTFGQQAGLCIY